MAGLTITQRIEKKVGETFGAESFSLEDDSAKHAGHAGHQPGGETHFNLSVISDAFAGKNRVQRQRMIYQLLAEELEERVHALSLSLKAPGE